MFGSNFDTNFGLPAFPFQGIDPQGGALAPNQSPAADPSLPGSPPAPPAAAPSLPGGGGPAQPALGGTTSPLGGGILAPGGQNPQQLAQQVPEQNQAPAAGIGSPFQKANV
jgi:hypothetical protein